MKVGYDFHGVIDKYPKQFAGFARILKELGQTVTLISAIPDNIESSMYKLKLEKICRDFDLPLEEIIIVPFVSGEHTSIAPLKLEACKKAEITHYFDDRGDVVNLLKENGIKAIRV